MPITAGALGLLLRVQVALSTRPRTTSVVIRDVEEEPRRATSVSIIHNQDKEFEDVQARMDADALKEEKLYEKEQKWIKDFIPMDSEEVKESSNIRREQEQNLMKNLKDLVKKRVSTTEPTDDKEKELWVELKRLFEPDNDGYSGESVKIMQILWYLRLYDTLVFTHVSSVIGHEIYVVEKEYPLTKEHLD
ncbi:hypothetical protein Tco_1523627 [Tanacetum coccineum]